MPLPSSGNPISLGQIQTEFGGSAPTSISEYYRGGAYTTSNNTNVPTSGRIKFSDFYGAVNEIVKYITATSTNVNASSYFTAGEWSSSAPKRLVINSGVTVGATNTSNYALNIPSGFGGTFKLDNNGSIQGAGGAENSGTGGNAIFAGAAGISINNQGTIYSGGGGGGQGGTGGAGFYTYDYVVAENRGYYRNRGGDCGCPSPYYCWPGSQYMNNSSDPCCGGGQNTPGECFCCTENVTYTARVDTSGGAGGNGGVGRGYNQSAAGGLGGAGGGTGAGNGGTGGTGGDWGTGGGNGNVGANGNAGGAPGLGISGGPAYGGLAGFYIVNNSNVTWIANGTRAGRVG